MGVSIDQAGKNCRVSQVNDFCVGWNGQPGTDCRNLFADDEHDSIVHDGVALTVNQTPRPYRYGLVVLASLLCVQRAACHCDQAEQRDDPKTTVQHFCSLFALCCQVIMSKN